MRLVIGFSAVMLLSGCSGVPLDQQSNYGLCSTYASSAPTGAGGRVVLGLSTLGISEIGEASKRSIHADTKREMARRGIDECSVEGNTYLFAIIVQSTGSIALNHYV